MAGPDRRFSPAKSLVIRSLTVDLLTGRVISSLRRAGIPTILLKGPAVARWLYDEGAARSYVDTDLLLAPDDFPAAERVLVGLGFEREGLGTIPDDWPRHARTWLRSDGANVDLHRTFVGVGVTPAELWETLSAQTETMRVGGADLDVLRPAARALIVALHAAKDGGRIAKVRHDLGHAIERLPVDLWRETALLAARLQATATLGAGLRRSPAGAALRRSWVCPPRRPWRWPFGHTGPRPWRWASIGFSPPPAGARRSRLSLARSCRRRSFFVPGSRWRNEAGWDSRLPTYGVRYG